MKVLLANPPAFFANDKRHFIQAGSRWSFGMFVPRNFKDHYLPYPFHLGYSLSIIKQAGTVEVRGLDACALDMDDRKFVEEVKAYHPNLLMMDVPTISFPLVMPLLQEIKEAIGCKIVLGGGHVTALHDAVMSQYNFIDYCLLAEYEITLKQLVNIEAGGMGEAGEVIGLAYRVDGRVLVNPPDVQSFNLDDLPYPDREDFPIRHYHDFETAGRPCAQMLTSLGCPYKCDFCMPVRVMFQNDSLQRRRKPEALVDEMVLLRDKYGAKSVYFDDDTFAVDRARLKAFCDELDRRNVRIPWAAMGDITLDWETLKRLGESGCVGLKFGVETSNPATAKAIHKNFMNIEKVKTFVKWCKQLGIWSHATFIIGLPGDRREDILNTVEFAKKLDPDSVQFSIATPFPGTPFYAQAKENNWIVTDDFTQYDGGNYSVLSYPWLNKEEIEELHRVALRKWHVNALIHEIRRPRRVMRAIRSKSVIYATRKTVSHLRGSL